MMMVYTTELQSMRGKNIELKRETDKSTITDRDFPPQWIQQLDKIRQDMEELTNSQKPTGPN